jgi:hypothetical protein
MVAEITERWVPSFQLGAIESGFNCALIGAVGTVWQPRGMRIQIPQFLDIQKQRHISRH